MSRFPPPLFLTATFSFLVGPFPPPKRVDLLVPPTERKEGQTSFNSRGTIELKSFGPETDPFLSLVAFLVHEGGEGHMQPLASRVLPTAC